MSEANPSKNKSTAKNEETFNHEKHEGHEKNILTRRREGTKAPSP